MEYYRFVGSEGDYEGQFVAGGIYQGGVTDGEIKGVRCFASMHPVDWEYVGEKYPEDSKYPDEISFENKIHAVVEPIVNMLIEKNKKYGNSALEPSKVFSKASAIEGINIRIDDKLKRIANNVDGDLEDSELDLIGYLLLKRMLVLGETK